MEMADIVVVGGGVLGMSAAYHLAAAGAGRVVLLERAHFGAGSTSRATGGFRCQFGSEVNVRLSLLSRQALLTFEEETGVDPGYDPVGYLFLAESEGRLAALRAALAVQRAVGETRAREVSAAEAAHLNPALELDGVMGGTFGAWDGFIRPLQVLEGYRRAALRAGADLRAGVGEVALELRAGRVAGVRFAGGHITAPRVVNAAGPWAAGWLREVGVALPVTPSRRQVAVTEPFAGLSARAPLSVFLSDGFHYRVRDGRVLLLLPPRTPDGVESGESVAEEVDDAWLARVWARARACVPVLARTGLERAACWSGFYELSPDHHALLGEWPEMPGLWLLTGASGHGVMHAPALGRLLAEAMLGQILSLDVAPLAPGRFVAGYVSTSHAAGSVLL